MTRSESEHSTNTATPQPQPNSNESWHDATEAEAAEPFPISIWDPVEATRSRPTVFYDPGEGDKINNQPNPTSPAEDPTEFNKPVSEPNIGASLSLSDIDPPPPDIPESCTMSPNNRARCLWAFAFVVLAVAIGLIAASLKKVPSTEMGVQYNIHKKQLDDAAKSGGLFLGPPGFEFIKFPSTFISVDLYDRTCVSNDGLLVTFSVTFQYQMTAANVNPAIKKYRNFDKWASMVEQAGISAIHHSCSEFFVSEFQNKRVIIQSTMEKNLKLKLEGNPETGEEGVNAVAVSLQLSNLDLPKEYSLAVAEKQAAEEDIQLAKNQRNQETTKANTKLLSAKEEARKILDTANNEAEVLLTEARLKAEETLYSFEKEAEALVEVRDSLDLTTEGLLAYLSNRLLAEAQSLKVTTGEPAKMSRRDEL